MIIEELEKALQSFKNTSSIDALNNLLLVALADFHIHTFSFTYYQQHPKSTQRIKYHFCSPSYLPWHEHYLNQQYNDIDTTLHSVSKSILPLPWNLKEKTYCAKSQQEQQMRLDSIAFGATGGASIPIHAPDIEFGCMNLVQMKDETWLETLKQTQKNLQTLAIHYFEHLRAHTFHKSFASQNAHLSPREQQCLSLTKKRYSVEEIANHLSI